MKKIISGINNKRLELFIFGVVASLYFFAYFQRVAVPGTIFNQLQSDLQISASAITGLGATFMYVYAIAQLFVGMLADKYGGMRVLTAGGILLCIGSVMFPLSHELWLLYLSRAIIGLGASTMFLSIIKEVDGMFGKKNFALMLGALYFIGYFGGLAGTLPFERVVSLWGWRNSLIGIAIATIIIFVFVVVTGRHMKKKEISKYPLTIKPLLAILKNKHSLPLFFSGSANFAIYFIIQTVVGKKFLEDYAGMDSCAAASFTFIMMLFAMFTLFGSGLISRFTGNKRKIFIMIATSLCIINSVMMIIGMAWHFKGSFFLLCYVLYAISSGFATIFVSTAKELNPPEYVALSTGVLNCLCYLNVAVMSNIAGFIMDRFKTDTIKNASSVIYPANAYLSVFTMLLALSIVSFFVSFFIRETNGNHIFD